MGRIGWGWGCIGFQFIIGVGIYVLTAVIIVIILSRWLRARIPQRRWTHLALAEVMSIPITIGLIYFLHSLQVI